MNQGKLHKVYSLFDKNYGRSAMNVISPSLEEVARPWFQDIVDPQIDRALRDLNCSGSRRRQALDFLGLEIVEMPAVA